MIETDDPIKLEVTYDTMVVENNMLSIFPDVYSWDKDRVTKLRKELSTNGIEDSAITDGTLKKMIAKAVGKRKYVISLDDVRAGNYLTGKTLYVVTKTAPKKKRKRTRRK